MIRDAIAILVRGVNLDRDMAAAALRSIMSGECTDAQIACFLTALRMKGETVDEIVGCASVMREKATRIVAPEGVIDTCGTGGDASRTFNISTAAAIVAAAAGAKVAKHGNRSVSSSSGSADVLRELGVTIETEPATVETCLREVGIGFLFAPLLHGAMKHAIAPRRELGIRTIFNLLGPLTNPAGAKRQVLGVYERSLVEPLAEVLRELGSEHALVVHGSDGLDEITISGKTTVAELKEGKVSVYEISPADFGLQVSSLDSIRVADTAQSAACIRKVFSGDSGAGRDIVCLNAGAALYVAGVATNLREGVTAAAAALDSGQANATLAALCAASSQGCG